MSIRALSGCYTTNYTHTHSHSHVLVNLHIFDIYVFANMLVEIVVYRIYNISYIYLYCTTGENISCLVQLRCIYARTPHIPTYVLWVCVCGASLMHNAIYIGKYIQSIYPYPIIYNRRAREKVCGKPANLPHLLI